MEGQQKDNQIMKEYETLFDFNLLELKNGTENLKKDIDQIKQQKIELIHSHYNLLLESEYKVKSSYEAIKDLKEDNNKVILYPIDNLNNGIIKFCENNQLLKDKKLNLSLINQHLHELQNILDLPLLSTSLIQKNEFKEAIGLIQKVDKLISYVNKQEEVDNLILIKVKERMELSMVKMVSELLRLLKKDNLSLKDSITLVDYLKQTNYFNLYQLKYVFLLVRFNAFILKKQNFMINSNNEDIISKNLKKSIELSIEFILELTSMFKACFPNLKKQINNEVLIYYLIQYNIIEPLIQQYNNTINHINQPNTLISILNQLCLFGNNTAKIGWDFRYFIIDFVKDKALSLFMNMLTNNTTQLINTLNNFNNRIYIKLKDVDDNIKVLNSPNPIYFEYIQKYKLLDFNVPKEIKLFLPFVNYINQTLLTFNLIRNIAFYDIKLPLLDHLKNQFKNIGIKLNELKPKDINSNDIVKKYNFIIQTLFLDLLIPYLSYTFILGIYNDINLIEKPKELEDLIELPMFRLLLPIIKK